MTDTPTSSADSCILKVVVGSHAHGLAGPESDKDFRSVFVLPTAELFRVGFKYQGTRMMKEEDDETAWEIGHFLQLALQSHPLVLETLVAPVVTMDDWGAELRHLFPRLWSAQAAYESFLNYCDNQRKKMLEKKDGRPAKYAAAYVRVLFNLCELLERGTFSIRISETPVGEAVAKIKAGHFRPGEVIDMGEHWADVAAQRLRTCSQQARPELADAFLLKVRKAFLA
ncbi:MAG: nucleotidyltransferase domain-containing protein [Nitrospira sp.]|nr:nucleotidyltransferase domain-containing protein [Nitrospira sp.]MCS6317645.1 nucleotidyltransferase domain-containing protein [Nitrospira sp.]